RGDRFWTAGRVGLLEPPGSDRTPRLPPVARFGGLRRDPRDRGGLLEALARLGLIDWLAGVLRHARLDLDRMSITTPQPRQQGAVRHDRPGHNHRRLLPKAGQ